MSYLSFLSKVKPSIVAFMRARRVGHGTPFASFDASTFLHSKVNGSDCESDRLSASSCIDKCSEPAPTSSFNSFIIAKMRTFIFLSATLAVLVCAGAVQPISDFNQGELTFFGGAPDGMNPSSPSYGTKDVSMRRQPRRILAILQLCLTSVHIAISVRLAAAIQKFASNALLTLDFNFFICFATAGILRLRADPAKLVPLLLNRGFEP